MENKLNSLVQRKAYKGRNVVELIGNNRLRVIRESITGRNEQVLSLFDLHPESEKHMHRPVKFLAAAVLSVLLAFAFLLNLTPYAGEMALALTAAFCIGAVFFILQYLDKSTDVTLFRYRSNGEVALTFWNGLPDQAALSAFVEGLSSVIRSIRINPELSPAKKLEIYRNSLEFLVSESVMTKDEAVDIFERNRARLQGAEKAKLYSITPDS